MVQINLPENSQVKKGKYFEDKTGSKNLRKVNVYRWDPSTGENPRIDTYEVDMDNCPSKVLDIQYREQILKILVDQYYHGSLGPKVLFRTRKSIFFEFLLLLLDQH